MSGNRIDFGGSILDDKRQILDGLSDKEDFVKALLGYLTSMQVRCLNVNHPPMDWF